MHLVGFIIRIYHDARSPERQKLITELPDVLAIDGLKNLEQTETSLS